MGVCSFQRPFMHHRWSCTCVRLGKCQPALLFVTGRFGSADGGGYRRPLCQAVLVFVVLDGGVLPDVQYHALKETIFKMFLTLLRRRRCSPRRRRKEGGTGRGERPPSAGLGCGSPGFWLFGGVRVLRTPPKRRTCFWPFWQCGRRWLPPSALPGRTCLCGTGRRVLSPPSSAMLLKVIIL